VFFAIEGLLAECHIFGAVKGWGGWHTLKLELARSLRVGAALFEVSGSVRFLTLLIFALNSPRPFEYSKNFPANYFANIFLQVA
jgi:hypothetical protein